MKRIPARIPARVPACIVGLLLAAVLAAGCAAQGNGGGELKTSGDVKTSAVKIKR